MEVDEVSDDTRGERHQSHHQHPGVGHGHRFESQMASNIWPARPEGFRETFIQLFAAFDTAGDRLLSAIARHLKLAPDWFDHAVRDGNSVLRLLHYPPIPIDAEGVRAGAHEDINLITLLLGAEEAGLELLDKDGRWLAIKPPEGAMVVNVGDMLQRLTNHVLPSTTHPPGKRTKPGFRSAIICAMSGR